MVVKKFKENLSVKKKYAALGVNRNSYYKWQNRKPEKIDEYAEAEINRLYHKHKGTYGRDRITQAMRNAGTVINHKKVYRIMRKLGLKAVICRKWRIRNI